MPTVNETLNQLGRSIVNDIKEAMAAEGINASGESSKSLRYEVNANDTGIRLAVYGGPGVFFTDKGRGPTRNRGGNGGFSKEDAKKWAADKRIGTWTKENGKAMTKDEQAFLIMRKVHQKGFYGDNSQGKDYVTPITDKATASLEQSLRLSVLDLVKKKLNYGTDKNRAA